MLDSDEAIRRLAERPAAAEERDLLRLFANTQELVQFGIPSISQSQWRRNLKYASLLYALHEPTKTWRRAQVDAVGAAGEDEELIRIAFETGWEEDKKWISRSSVLLKEGQDVRLHWQQDLEVGALCDVFVDSKRGWQPVPVLALDLEQGKAQFGGGSSSSWLTLATSPLVAEHNTRSGQKPRFSWRGERVPMSLHSLQSYGETPLILHAARVFVSNQGVEHALQALKECDGEEEELALLLAQACGNGLVQRHQDNRDDDIAVKQLVEELFRVLSSASGGHRLRIALPYLETFMRSYGDGVFTEREICDRVELASLQVSLELITSTESGMCSSAMQGIKLACERVFAAAAATVTTAEYALTRQELVNQLYKSGALTQTTLTTTALAKWMPEIAAVLASSSGDEDAVLAVALVCGGGVPNQQMVQVLRVLLLQQQQLVARFVNECGELNSALCAVQAAVGGSTDDGVLLNTLLTATLRRFNDDDDACVPKMMEMLFQADGGGVLFPARCRQLMWALLLKADDCSSNALDRVAEFVVLGEEDEELRAALLKVGKLSALFRCDGACADQWLPTACAADVDGFLVSAVDFWLVQREEEEANDDDEDDKDKQQQHGASTELAAQQLWAALRAGAIRPRSAQALLAAIKLTGEMGENGHGDMLDDWLVEYIALPQEHAVTNELASVVHQHSLFPSLVRALERSSPSSLVINAVAAQLDCGDVWGTRGNRAHSSVVRQSTSSVTVTFTSAGAQQHGEYIQLASSTIDSLQPVNAAAAAGTTIWDLKFLIAKQLNNGGGEPEVQPQDLGLLLAARDFYPHDKSNAEFLAAAADGEGGGTVQCAVYQVDRSATAAAPEPLLRKRRMPPVLGKRAEAAFTRIFEDSTFGSCAANDDDEEVVLSHEAFADVYLKCTGKTITAAQVKQIFTKLAYVRCAERGMRLSEFLHMYALQALKDGDRVRQDLAQFGYCPVSLVLKSTDTRLTFDFEAAVAAASSSSTSTATFRSEMVKSGARVYQALHELACGGDQSASARGVLLRLPTDPHYAGLSVADAAAAAKSVDWLYWLDVHRDDAHDDEEIGGVLVPLLQSLAATTTTEADKALAASISNVLVQRKGNLGCCCCSPALAWDLYFDAQLLPDLRLFEAVGGGAVTSAQLERWLASRGKALREGYRALRSIGNNIPECKALSMPPSGGVSTLAVWALMAPHEIPSGAQDVVLHLLQKASSSNDDDDDVDYFACQVLLHLPALTARAQELAYARYLATGIEDWLAVASREGGEGVVVALFERDLLASLPFAGEERSNPQQQPCPALGANNQEALARWLCQCAVAENSNTDDDYGAYLVQSLWHSQLKQIWVESSSLAAVATVGGGCFQVKVTTVCDGCGACRTVQEAGRGLTLSLTQPSLQEQLNKLQQAERDQADLCSHCGRQGSVCRTRDYTAPTTSSSSDTLFIELIPTEQRRRVHLHSTKAKASSSSSRNVGGGVINWLRNEWRIGAVLYTRGDAWQVATARGWRLDVTHQRCYGGGYLLDANTLDAIANDPMVTMRGVTLVRCSSEDEGRRPALTHARVMEDNAQLVRIYQRLLPAGKALLHGSGSADAARFLYMLRFPDQPLQPPTAAPPASNVVAESFTFDFSGCSEFDEGNDNQPTTCAFTSSVVRLMQDGAVWQRLCESGAFGVLIDLFTQDDVEYVFDRLLREDDEQQHLPLACCMLRKFPSLLCTRARPAQQLLFANQRRFELDALYVQYCDGDGDDLVGLLAGRESAFLSCVDNAELAASVARRWPQPAVLFAAVVDCVFAKEEEDDRRLLLLLSVVRPPVDTVLMDAMQAHADHCPPARVALCIRHILACELVPRTQVGFVNSFLIHNGEFALAAEWMDAVPAVAEAMAVVCFLLPEAAFRQATAALLALRTDFQLAWFSLLKANRRDNEHVRVLMGLLCLLQQPSDALARFVHALLELPVPRDEDRVTDWVVRFLQRWPQQQEDTEFVPMAMEALEQWIAKVDNELDVYRTGGALLFPREPASVLVRVALGTKLEEHLSEHVMLQVMDCDEWLVFWGVNGRRDAVELVLAFDATGEEAFALPEGVGGEVVKPLLPGQSAVVFAGRRVVEKAAQEGAPRWGRFLFRWGLFLPEETQPQEAGAEVNHSSESATFVNDQALGAGTSTGGASSSPSFCGSSAVMQETTAAATRALSSSDDFLFDDAAAAVDEEHEFSAIFAPQQQAAAPLFDDSSTPFGSFLQDGGGGGAAEDASWMQTGEDPFEDEEEEE